MSITEDNKETSNLVAGAASRANGGFNSIIEQSKSILWVIVWIGNNNQDITKSIKKPKRNPEVNKSQAAKHEVNPNAPEDKLGINLLEVHEQKDKEASNKEGFITTLKKAVEQNKSVSQDSKKSKTDTKSKNREKREILVGAHNS